MGSFFKNIFQGFSGPVFLFIGFAVIFYTLRTINIDFLAILTWIVLFAPIWMPFTLFYITFDRWMEFVRLKFQDRCGRVTLEIKLPQEVHKSPQAMEEVLTQTWNKNTAYNLFQAYWDGKHGMTCSFELVSIGGDIRFYANLPRKKAKDVFEAQLYAQYPGVEVTEVPIDYTAEIPWDPEKWELMSFHFGKAEDEVYPIKTYVDFGLDKNPKEEEKIEPMAPVLELLNGLNPSERLWIQILATPHRKKGLARGELRESPEWTKKARAKINEIMQRDDDGKPREGYESLPRTTDGEKELVKHIERNVSKMAFETAVRVIYATPKGKFKGETISSMVRALAGSFMVVGRNDLAVRWRTDFDYNVFQDYSGKRKLSFKRRELDFYKLRAYVPFAAGTGADAPKVMSVEEIATMWHLPGQAIVTPGINRVESIRQNAPPNLPVGGGDDTWVK